MTIDEFKQLKVGDRVQFLAQPAMQILMVDVYIDVVDDDELVEYVGEIVLEDGTTLNVSDPIQWIFNLRKVE